MFITIFFLFSSFSFLVDFSEIFSHGFSYFVMMWYVRVPWQLSTPLSGNKTCMIFFFSSSLVDVILCNVVSFSSWDDCSLSTRRGTYFFFTFYGLFFHSWVFNKSMKFPHSHEKCLLIIQKRNFAAPWNLFISFTETSPNTILE